MPQRTYTDDDLARAVDVSRSWRGVLRTLGLKATSAGATRSVRRRAELLGLDSTHFTGQRRWSDDDLASAVAESRTWHQVQDKLGLRGGGCVQALKDHAVRLNLDCTHFGRHVQPPPGMLTLLPALDNLPKSGSLMAASWFTMCGYEVTWPLEPCRYDLIVIKHGEFLRVQVKTTRCHRGVGWVASIGSTSASQRAYGTDEIDYFFVIDGDLDYYLVPVSAVGGRASINLSNYDAFRVDRTLDASTSLSPPEPSPG